VPLLPPLPLPLPDEPEPLDPLEAGVLEAGVLEAGVLDGVLDELLSLDDDPASDLLSDDFDSGLVDA